MFRAEYERASAAGVDTMSPRWKTPVGDDFQRLRGLLAVAPGVRGCQPGTDPVQALLRKESYRERRR